MWKDGLVTDELTIQHKNMLLFSKVERLRSDRCVYYDIIKGCVTLMLGKIGIYKLKGGIAEHPRS